MTEDDGSRSEGDGEETAEEAPQVFVVQKDVTGWRFTRRRFLATVTTAGVGVAASTAGCGGGADPAPTTQVATVTELPPVTTEPPTSTPEPTAVPTATPVPVPKSCFVSDVTIPDNTVMAPSTSFTKTWRVKNCGTAPFGSGTTLRFTRGERMGAPESVAVGGIAPGESTDIGVDMTAPGAPGSYKGEWHIQTGAGKTLGGPLTVVIQVASQEPIAAGSEGVRVTVQNKEYTLPCGSPIPAGAVCTCNCVSVPAAKPACSCDSVCTCDEVCTCNPQGSHYWHPN